MLCALFVTDDVCCVVFKRRLHGARGELAESIALGVHARIDQQALPIRAYVNQTYQDTTATCINTAYAQHASYDMHRGTARVTYSTRRAASS